MGLYVHVPFCARRCPYCDFDFEVGRTPDVPAFIAGLEAEWVARCLGDDRLPVSTVYVGGGTPSAIGPDGLARLFAWIDRRVDRSGASECTVELNPEHVDDPLLAALLACGVDRLSIGVQSFDSRGLAELGRVHDGAQAAGALARCARTMLPTSVDLIVGWPGQTPSALDADLDAVLAAEVGHVSVYALTIEPGTPWPKLVRRGLRRLPDDEVQAELLARVEARLGAAGFDHYEIASYARPGARAIHNSGYWRGRDYVGLGPSAASAWHDGAGTVTRHTNARGVASWRAAPGAGDDEVLAGEASAAEALWLGLRLLRGVSVDDLVRRHPAVDAAWLRRRLARPLARGDVCEIAGGYAVAPGRWLIHDAIARDVLG